MAIPSKPLAGKVPAPKSDAAIIEELKRQFGFTDDFIPSPRRLVVSSWGSEKTGKTTFALSAPEPIIYFDIDRGAEGVVGKLQQDEEGNSLKKIYWKRIRPPKQANQDVFVSVWEDLKQQLQKAWSLSKGTVILDTSSEAYETLRLARLGKLAQVPPLQYTVTNREWKELVDDAYESSMNTIFIHKDRPVWADYVDSQGKTKSRKTKEREMIGLEGMAFIVQISIQHLREDSDDEVTFSVFVDECRHNAGLSKTAIPGLPLPRGEQRVGDPLCNFTTLLGLVHGPEKENK